MQVCTSLQTDNLASTPPLSFLQAGCHSCHPTNSVKALKATVLFVISVALVLLSFILLFELLNQATGYASQHYLASVPGQDKLAGLLQEGIQHKNGVMMEVGALTVQMQWRPDRMSVSLPP